MKNTFTIDADIKKTSYFNQPTVTQNDDITFVVNISDDGQAFDLADVTTVSLANTKPDNEVVVTPGVISGTNQVTFVLGTNETAVSGTVNAVVQLYDVDGRVSTLSFSYVVKSDPTGSGYVTSTDEQTLIEVVLNDGPLRIQEAIDAGDYANLQGDYALAQGDYAKTEADRLVATGVSTLDVRVTDNTAQLAETALQTDLLTTDTIAKDAQAKANSPLTQIQDYSIPSLKLKVLNESDRLGLTNLKQEVLDAITGTTSILSTVADGIITPIKTSFFEFSKNLFNKETASIGYYVNHGTGLLGASEIYSTTDHIKVLPNESYTRTIDNRVAFYDDNKNFISGLLSVGSLTFITPANCAYVKCTFSIGGINTYQVELGSVATKYESFSYAIPKNLIETYLPPTCVLTSASYGATVFSKTYTKGTSVDPFRLNLSITKQSKNIEKLTFKHNGTIIYENLNPSNSSGTYLLTAPITEDAVYTVEVFDGVSTVTSNEIKVNFVYQMYIGQMNDTVTNPTETRIKALLGLVTVKQDSKRIYTITNLKPVFAYPTSYGDLKEIVDRNSFNVLASFIKSTTSMTMGDAQLVGYNVYLFDDGVTLNNFDITYKFEVVI